MSIVGQILEIARRANPGKKSKRHAIAAEILAVDKALGQMAAERDRLNQVVIESLKNRRDLLLQDDLRAVEALDREADMARLRLEQLDLLEPELLKRQAELRSAARTAAWEDLAARFDVAAGDYVAAARIALGRFDVAMAVVKEAMAAGFDRERQFLLPQLPMLNGAPILSDDILGRFEAALEKRREALDPKPVARMSKPIAEPVAEISAPANSKAPAPPAKRPKTPREIRKISGDIPDGMSAVVLLRSGLPLGDGSLGYIGDQVILDRDQAEAVVRNGAADFLTNPLPLLAKEAPNA